MQTLVFNYGGDFRSHEISLGGGILCFLLGFKGADLAQGLAFLHEHRIFHRVRMLVRQIFLDFSQSTPQDISESNMLVNHVPSFINSFSSMEKTLNRRQLRAAGLLTYCLFDFDLSLMLPSGKPLSDYRLPIDESFPGVFYKPHGVEQDQVDFNPFRSEEHSLNSSHLRRSRMPSSA